MKGQPKKSSKAATPAVAEKPEGVFEVAHRKRDLITSNLTRVSLGSDYEEALTRMEDHLHTLQKRCTVERRFVLQMLYQLSQPVDITTLHSLICDELGNVAVPTVYSTLDLLVQLHLARRIELIGHSMAFFERTLGLAPHGYAVCSSCGVLQVLPAPSVLESVQNALPRGFAAEDFTFVVHGLCSRCKRARRAKKTTKSINTPSNNTTNQHNNKKK